MKTHYLKLMPIIITLIIIKALPALTQNSGWKWQNPLPQGNTLYDIEAIDLQTAITVGQSGTIMKTTNRGSTWNMISTEFESASWLNICSSDENTLWAVSASQLIKSTNGGETWSPVLYTMTGAFRCVYFFDANRGWLSGKGANGNSMVRYTTDGGLNWTEVYTSSNRTLNSVYFAVALNGWAAGDWGYIIHTVD